MKADRRMKHSVAVDAAFGLRSHWLNARCLKAEQCSTRWGEFRDAYCKDKHP